MSDPEHHGECYAQEGGPCNCGAVPIALWRRGAQRLLRSWWAREMEVLGPVKLPKGRWRRAIYLAGYKQLSYLARGMTRRHRRYARERHERLMDKTVILGPKQRWWHDCEQHTDGNWYCVGCGTRVPTPPQQSLPLAKEEERRDDG
jgi:hypothetical protein